MSPSPNSHPARRNLLPEGAACGRIVRMALAVPLVLLVAAVVALTLYCRVLLSEAAEGRIVAVGDAPLLLFAGGFLVASAAVVVVQSLRVASRVVGPEFRLRQALQQIRKGDIGFRVHLRRGDLLTGLADECNELLDWLNTNPPQGVSKGTDVVRVAAARPAVRDQLVEVAP